MVVIASDVQSEKAFAKHLSKFVIEAQLHDVQAMPRALPGDRVKGHGSGDPAEVDGVQVRQDGAAVHPRHDGVAVALDAARLVVEDLAAAERASKNVGVAREERAKTVDDHVNRIHHQRHVHLQSVRRNFVQRLHQLRK